MDTEATTRNASLRRDVWVAVFLLAIALGVLFFMPRNPDIRPAIWWLTKGAFVVLNAVNLAYNLWRWRAYKA